MVSLIIPVYKNEESIPGLLEALAQLAGTLSDPLEVVFVDDGSPDRSHALLAALLPQQPFVSQLLVHSRNFGSFAAIRSGLSAAQGRHFAVMAADLQEPISLIEEFFKRLAGGAVDVVIGQRDARRDPMLSGVSSRLFWWTYRRFIEPAIPPGGIDVFGCNDVFRRFLLALEESNSSLVGLLFWMGFRRELVPYARLERKHGKSAWTFQKKLKYLNDSIYAFSDLPVRALFAVGALSTCASVVIAAIVLVAKLTGRIEVPGYTATVLTIVFFGGLNALGLGILGGYLWRAFENTKGRPSAIVMSQQRFEGTR
jgi:glycosyltransferase involved in cell wall biosynthesis